MRKVWAVAVREYRASVRSKAFVISVVAMPVFMGISVLVQRGLKGRVDLDEKKILVFDRTGKLMPTLREAAVNRNEREIYDKQSTRQIEAKYLVEAAAIDELTDEDRYALSQRVRRHEISAFVEIGSSVITDSSIHPGTADVHFCSESEMSNDMSRWCRRAIAQAVHSQRLHDAGLDPELVHRATAPVEVDVLGLYSKSADGTIKKADENSRSAAIFVPMAVMMLMFLTIMMSQDLLRSTLEERQQKIAEVLLGSVPPFQLMMGKLVGSVGVSLTVMAIYLAGGIWMLDYLGYREMLPSGLIVWFMVFQVLGVFIFGSIFVAVGATCNDLSEARNYLMPVMMVMVLPMVVWFRVLQEPLGSFATWLSFFPPATPMLMMLRMSATSAIPLWQPLAGIATTFAGTLVCVWMAGRIFRLGLLMQGKAPRVTELLRFAIRG